MGDWKKGIVNFLEGQDNETVFDINYVKVIVAHALIYGGTNPPEEEVINRFLYKYIDRKFGEVELLSTSHGIGKHYVGYVKKGTSVRHGLGVQYEIGKYVHTGYFFNDEFHAYGCKRDYDTGEVIECGMWENGKLVKRCALRHVAISDVIKRTQEMASKFFIDKTKSNNSNFHLLNEFNN